MGKDLTIVHLEDVATDHELIARELRKAGLSCRLTRVETEKAFLSALDEIHPDLILADYSLPTFNGLNALALAQERHPEVPFIFVSGTLGEEVAIESLRSGATDYVLKQRLARLGPAVRRAVEELQERLERKQAEEAKVQLQIKLAAAQKMELIGRFSAGIAHDFHNYLSVIHGFAELIMMRRQRESDEETIKQLTEILHAVKSGRALIQQLMTYSRQQPVQPTSIDLNQALRDMEKILRQLVGEGVEVGLALATQPLVARLDPTAFEQIVMNLSSNARDAMKKKGVLTLTTQRIVSDKAFQAARSWSQSGEYVKFSLQDSGPGMDAAAAARIFEPFFTTKQLGLGTGLGLAVVHQLVEQHEGHIEVETGPGRGTAFHLYFPMIHAPHSAGEEITTRETGGSPTASKMADPAPSKTRRRVLVVDDESGGRVICDAILGSVFEVTTASSAEEALELLRRGSQDVLLSDIQMPGMDGIALITEVVKKHPRIKVVAMSAFMTSEIEQRLRAVAPNCQILRKPLHPDETVGAINRCLAG